MKSIKGGVMIMKEPSAMTLDIFCKVSYVNNFKIIIIDKNKKINQKGYVKKVSTNPVKWPLLFEFVKISRKALIKLAE